MEPVSPFPNESPIRRPKTTERLRNHCTLLEHCTPFNHLFPEEPVGSTNQAGFSDLAVANYYMILRERLLQEERMRLLMYSFAPQPGSPKYEEWLKHMGGTMPKGGFKKPVVPRLDA